MVTSKARRLETYWARAMASWMETERARPTERYWVRPMAKWTAVKKNVMLVQQKYDDFNAKIVEISF